MNRATDNNFSSKRLNLYKDFVEGVLYLIKRKVKKGIQIISDLLEILVNKDKTESIEASTVSDLNRNKKAANKSEDYLEYQCYIFRAYGYVAIEKYESAMEDIKTVTNKFASADNATIYNKWLGRGILRMDHEDYLMASKYFGKAWNRFPSNKDPYLLQVISIVNSYSYSLAGYSMD